MAESILEPLKEMVAIREREKGVKKACKKGCKEAREEGREEGVQEGMLKTALKMEQKGFSLETIQEVTGINNRTNR